MPEGSKTGPGYGPADVIKGEKKAKAKGAWSRLRKAKIRKNLRSVVKSKKRQVGEQDLSIFRPDK